jgi:capsular exopolysaccharide synthesis family protein
MEGDRMSVPAENLGVVRANVDPRLVALSEPASMAAEQYRVLMARLDRVAAVRPMRTIAVTSCARGEGRSLTAANLALTAARDGGREVLLVECDLRRPSLAQLFDVTARAGLAEVVEGTAELPEALVHVGGLTLLCAGEAGDVSAVVRSPRLSVVLDTLRSSFSLVVLDVPPALALSDSGRLAAAAEGILLVVRAGATPRDVVRMTVETLPDRLVGIVLNGVDQPAYARYLRSEAIGA